MNKALSGYWMIGMKLIQPNPDLLNKIIICKTD